MKRVLIDPGHGGRNFGTRGAGTPEKALNLMIAQELEQSLQGMDVEPLLTRTDDVRVSLYERGRASRKFAPDLTVCIHVNGSTDAARSGFEAYFLPGEASGCRSAHCARTSFGDLFGSTRILEAYNDPRKVDDDWMQNPINVMNPHAAAAVFLAECGYATNEHNRALLLSPWGRSQIVSRLRSGIAQYFYEHAANAA